MMKTNQGGKSNKYKREKTKWFYSQLTLLVLSLLLLAYCGKKTKCSSCFLVLSLPIILHALRYFKLSHWARRMVAVLHTDMLLKDWEKSKWSQSHNLVLLLIFQTICEQIDPMGWHCFYVLTLINIIAHWLLSAEPWIKRAASAC